MKYNNCGYYYSTFIPDVGHFWDTDIPENIDLSSNKIT